MNAARALALSCLVGCSDDGVAAELLPDAEIHASVPAPDAEEQASAVTVAVRSVPIELSPTAELDPWARRIVNDLLFEGLVGPDADGPPWARPALADRCVSDDEQAPAIIDCHLPRGRRFHDGREVMVEDVIAAFQFWLDPRRASLRTRHQMARMRSVELIDGPPDAAEARDVGRWVRIRYDGPEPLALERLGVVKIVPRERGQGGELSGTGPMRLVEKTDDRLVFDAVDDPSRRLIIREIDDAAAALSALRRGTVDLIELSWVHVPVELGKPGTASRFSAWLLTPPRYDGLLYNSARGSASVSGVRRALSQALPRGLISRELSRSPGWMVNAPVDLTEPTPIDLHRFVDADDVDPSEFGLPGWDDPNADSHRITQAGVALDALGWGLADGTRAQASGPLRVTLTWDDSAARAEPIAAAIRHAWQSLGARSPQATASWAYLTTLLRRGEFDAVLVHLAGGSDMDLFPWFHSRGESNYAGVADPELDAALIAYRRAGDRQGRDLAKRRVAAALVATGVFGMLHAPASILLASNRLKMEFRDNLPRLDLLKVRETPVSW